MAEGAALTFFLGNLTDSLDALLNNNQEVKNVHRQIEEMRNELRLIHAFLKDVDFKRNSNERIREWLNQVREIANRINIVINTFRVKIEENHPECWNLIRKIKRYYKTYKLSKELKYIIQARNRLYQCRTDLVIRVDDPEPSDKVDDPDPSDKVDDPEVVGLEVDKGEIINQLLDTSDLRRTVLSIVGFGGLGKTTLAKKVYKSTKLKDQFDFRAWHSISQNYKFNNLLREILYSVEPQMKNKSPPVTDGDLSGKLKSSLELKRYLIILDDVWDINLWEQLEKALPDRNNASRVIITTRSLDVAKTADRNTEPYKLRYRNDQEGLALLFRKAFQRHIKPEDYPRHLLEVATKLTKKCGGLPLALEVLGGILTRRKDTYSDWDTLEQTMDWQKEDGKNCLQILARSYEDLHDDIKPCFRYFASFPIDYMISGKHVTKMWVADGLIQEVRAGTLEQRAEEFLEDLVQRYLIQVTEISWNGNCKYCSMHDLLRELAIHEAKEKNLTVFSNSKDENQLAARKPCRVALQFCTPMEDVNSGNTRSLLCFGYGKDSWIDGGFGQLNFSDFELLRVLTIEGVDMTQLTSTEWLKGLIHLRYLGFRYCSIWQENFKNISSNNLETFDLKGSHIFEKTTYCSDVVIPTLRHIYGPRNYGMLFSLEWDHLTNLQTLKSVGQEEVPRLGCSTKNLRTLSIYYKRRTDRDEEWETLNGVLRRAKKLVSLSIVTSTDRQGEIPLPFGNDGTRGLPCHDTIQSLHLKGKWRDIHFELPNGKKVFRTNYPSLTSVDDELFSSDDGMLPTTDLSIVTSTNQQGEIMLPSDEMFPTDLGKIIPSVEMFPTNLTKLTLEFSNLLDDPMPIFERLQNLTILRLWTDSYLGENLICSTEGFPNLEKLEIKMLPRLHHLDIKEGAMPILRNLKINQCCELEVFPELQKVQTLQELSVHRPLRRLAQRMQEVDRYKIEHIPYVRITRDYNRLDE